MAAFHTQLGSANDVIRGLKNHLREVLKYADKELQAHKEKELEWREEKHALFAQLKLSQANSSSRAQSSDTEELQEEWRQASRSELESSVISLTKERDMLRAGISLQQTPGAHAEPEEDEESLNQTNSSSITPSPHREQDKMEDAKIIDRLIDENMTLQATIEHYEEELADAKQAVERAANYISKLKNENATKNVEIDTLQTENAMLKNSMETLKKQHKALTERLEHTTTDLKDTEDS